MNADNITFPMFLSQVVRLSLSLPHIFLTQVKFRRLRKSVLRTILISLLKTNHLPQGNFKIIHTKQGFNL